MDRRKVLLIVAAVIAALGTLLVFLYVRSADARANTKFDTVAVLKAAKQINAGDTIDAAQAAGAIVTATVAKQDLLEGALSGLEPIEGQVAQATIYPGEQIVSTKFGSSGDASALNIPPGLLAITVTVTDTARVAGFINPGDSIGIFVNASNGPQPVTRVLLPKVKVLAVGSTTPATEAAADPAAGVVEELPRTMFTLALTQAQAEKVLFASDNGGLTFTLLGKDTTLIPSGGVGPANLFQ